jgi:hypothetical protein
LNQVVNQILSVIEGNLRIEPFLNDLSIVKFTGEWINDENKIIKNFNEKKVKFILYLILYRILHIFHFQFYSHFLMENNDDYIIINPNFYISKQTLSSELNLYLLKKKQ